eukprot:SAG31_NODE_370_length_16651_cov_3.511056_6_plen_144_part_00
MTTVTTTFSLRSRATNADRVVSEFVAAAYRRYIDNMKETEDTRSRFMYTPLPKSDGHWKRYKLSDEKSFKTLFFPQKEQLLRLLKAFDDKTGKFAIKGCARRSLPLAHKSCFVHAWLRLRTVVHLGCRSPQAWSIAARPPWHR